MNQKRPYRPPAGLAGPQRLPETSVNGRTVAVGMDVTLHARPGRSGGRYTVVQIERDRTEEILISVQRGNEPWHYVRACAIRVVHVASRRK